MQFVIAYGSLALIIWAFVDALRFAADDYRRVDKMPRWAWLTLFAFAFAMLFWLGAFRFDEPLGPRRLMWAASMAMLGVYFYDMRPSCATPAQVADALERPIGERQYRPD